MSHEPNKLADEKQNRKQILSQYFKADSSRNNNRGLVRRYLLAAVEAALLVPLLFYWKFGTVSWFAIGFTVFLVVLCLLVALGLFFQNRSSFHTRVPAGSYVGDRIGAFWLMACAFGPLLGWFTTAVFPLTTGSWRWLCLVRVFFAVVLPLITAVPLVRYARGKATLIAVPLLLGITALPMLSCWWVISDLHDGPVSTAVTVSRNKITGALICAPASVPYDLPCDAARKSGGRGEIQVIWLPHSGRILQVS